MIGGGARFTPRTSNGKLNPVRWTRTRTRPRPAPVGPYCSVTSVSIAATCSARCPFLSTPGHPGPCYVQAGFQKFHADALDRAARGMTPFEVIDAEASHIELSFNGGPVPQDGPGGKGRGLRLHDGGDVEGRAGAKRLARAARNWMERGGSRPWTYTHRWHEIPRSDWGPISVLASIERADDLARARERGYASAITLAEFASEKAFDVQGWRVIPCPAETRQRTCVQCRLCWRADALLAERAAIAFKMHGSRKSLAILS